jgi:hypothetical protein
VRDIVATECGRKARISGSAARKLAFRLARRQGICLTPLLNSSLYGGKIPRLQRRVVMARSAILRVTLQAGGLIVAGRA